MFLSKMIDGVEVYNGWDLFGFFILGVFIVLFIIWFWHAIDDEKKRKLKKLEHDENMLNVLQFIVHNTTQIEVHLASMIHIQEYIMKKQAEISKSLNKKRK